jgi:hypothetical protein
MQLLLWMVMLIIQPVIIYAQRFSGSFLMSFTSSSVKQQPNMLWNVEAEPEGRTAMQIQDEMLEKGVSKRILFDPADSSWLMLMELNSIKQGARIHRAAMFRKDDNFAVKAERTGIIKSVNGYKCRKYILKSADYISEIYITDQLNFDLGHIYKMLCHCGMIDDDVKKGDWYKWNKKGMVLEVDTKSNDGQFYTVSISMIKQGITDMSMFNIKGFRISEIPEGQNCGPVTEH